MPERPSMTSYLLTKGFTIAQMEEEERKVQEGISGNELYKLLEQYRFGAPLSSPATPLQAINLQPGTGTRASQADEGKNFLCKMPTEILLDIFDDVVESTGCPSGEPICRHLLPYIRGYRFATIRLHWGWDLLAFSKSLDAALTSFMPFDKALLVKEVIGEPLEGYHRVLLPLNFCDALARMQNVTKVTLKDESPLRYFMLKIAGSGPYFFPSLSVLSIVESRKGGTALDIQHYAQLRRYPQLIELKVTCTEDTKYIWSTVLLDNDEDTPGTRPLPNPNIRTLRVEYWLTRAMTGEASEWQLQAQTRAFLGHFSGLRNLSVYDTSVGMDVGIILANLGCAATLVKLELHGNVNAHAASAEMWRDMYGERIIDEATFIPELARFNHISSLTLSGIPILEMDFSGLGARHSLKKLFLKGYKTFQLPLQGFADFLLSPDRPAGFQLLHISGTFTSLKGSPKSSLSTEAAPLVAVPEVSEEAIRELLRAAADTGVQVIVMKAQGEKEVVWDDWSWTEKDIAAKCCSQGGD